MISKIVRSVASLTVRSKSLTQVKALTSFNFAALEKVSKSQSRLLKAVERESKYEQENYEADTSVKEFLEEHKLILKESDNSIFLELHKDAGDYKVQILF